MDRDLHFVWGGGSGKLVPDYGRVSFKGKIHRKIEIVFCKYSKVAATN